MSALSTSIGVSVAGTVGVLEFGGVFCILPFVSPGSLLFVEGTLKGQSTQGLFTREGLLKLGFSCDRGCNQLTVGLRMIMFALNDFVKSIRKQMLVGWEVRFEDTFS